MKNYRFIEMIRDEHRRPIWSNEVVQTLASDGYVIESVTQLVVQPSIWISVLITMSKDVP